MKVNAWPDLSNSNRCENEKDNKDCGIFHNRYCGIFRLGYGRTWGPTLRTNVMSSEFKKYPFSYAWLHSHSFSPQSTVLFLFLDLHG